MKISAITLSLLAITLAACAAIKTPSPPTFAEVKPSLRLTLLPQGNIIEAKVTGTETRQLLLPEDLAAPMRLFAVDRTLNDFHFITPQKTGIPGVYSFPFALKPDSSYRVWVDIKQLPDAKGKTPPEEFPSTDLGARKPSAVAKTVSLDTNVSGYHATLTFDKTPTDKDDATGTLRITDKNGTAVNATADIIGIYEDFHSVFRIALDNKLTFTLNPGKAGFIKLFAVLHIDGKDMVVPFGVMVNKAS